ncbi:class I SAM-dependent methyltransferase [Halostella sp. JP-L12]|uniref:class I SAM-dependent methyltransferase n=1 Tax=Halostella TaxID=1843185 RepID=UPI000EF80D5D|nr:MULTISPECIES: class I SAM-dependent methyltransferase [Halostella]NHN48580.1 class I SAM-dependent methyltransferase [Halostella sp. JP-L12]
MDVPRTVETALEDRPVAGKTCLEAGAGVGNATAGLLAAGADRVYAVTDDRDHARTVRERVGRDAADRAAVIEADLLETPLPTGSVDVITAHGLFNVISPASLPAVAAELTRVAAPGCHLVVDDYEPPPEDAAVRDLFAVENAAAELADGRPALTFYPAEALRRLFAGYGWEFDRERTLLDPVPWTERHVEAHADAARGSASALPDELGDPLASSADRLADRISEESVGTMYSVAMRFPG